MMERYWAYICGVTDIYLPEPVTRIERYLGAICGGMILLPEPITKEEIYLYKIAKQREAVVKSVYGKTITMTDSLEAPFEDFHIYGHSTQETTTGAQLIDFSNANFDNCIVQDKTTGTIKCQMTNAYFCTITIYNLNAYLMENLGNPITLRTDNNINRISIVVFGTKTNGDAIQEISANGTNVSLTLATDFTEIKHIDVRFNRLGTTHTDTTSVISGIMLHAGSEALLFEPYTGGKPSPNPDYPQEIVSAGDKGNIDVSVTDGENSVQTLALSTPNGLPGIPVDSGGNYTDENGQQWVCDEIDFGRGVYMQRVWKLTADGSEVWGAYDSNRGFLSELLPENMNTRAGLSNQLRMITSSLYADYNNAILGVSNAIVYVVKSNFYDETLEDKGISNWKNHLAQHPLEILEIMTYLNEPIETPLSAEELAAYKALHTNYPTTVINNDEECHMEAGYKAKPVSQYSEEKTLEWLKGE